MATVSVPAPAAVLPVYVPGYAVIVEAAVPHAPPLDGASMPASAVRAASAEFDPPPQPVPIAMDAIKGIAAVRQLVNRGILGLCM